MIENIIYVILALIGLGILVFIHEFGHYLMAKKVGMKVEVFSIGFGKTLYSWDRNGVKWQLCVLPFGGYVKIAGMEKEGGLEPHEIKNGFFGKKPLDRIKVALAGPLVNITFALIAFSMIWAFGGRNKKFSEYTRKIGAIDITSPLYKNDIRAGDEIKSYCSRPYRGVTDLMYASVLDGKKCDISGDKLDYLNNVEKTPFEYDLNTYKVESPLAGAINTIGINSPASFLIYDSHISDISKSPMKDSGITGGDRIIWANGEVVFSQYQLSSLINDEFSFLTLSRNGNIFHVKVPKVKIEDINLNKFDKEEIDDWRHEANIKTALSDLYFLPYYFNENGVIENKLDFIDENIEAGLFKIDERNVFSKELDRGDKIIAVDGVPVTSSYDILNLLQEPHVLMIVQRDDVESKQVSWKMADDYFNGTFKSDELSKLIQTIGTLDSSKSHGDLHILKPIVPVTLDQLYNDMGLKDVLVQELAYSKKKIQKIEDEKERAKALESIESSKSQLKLGVALKDKIVKYNPTPFSMFYLSLADIWKTLSSLVTGKLSPKWMAGPVGIVQVMHHSWSLGFSEVLYWLGLISLNLGIINLLPLPVLDGGHIVFAGVEMITGKPIKAKTMEKFIFPFIILMIGLFIFFTYNDILRLVKSFF